MIPEERTAVIESKGEGQKEEVKKSFGEPFAPIVHPKSMRDEEWVVIFSRRGFKVAPLCQLDCFRGPASAS